jgi:hypothetical protein
MAVFPGQTDASAAFENEMAILDRILAFVADFEAILELSNYDSDEIIEFAKQSVLFEQYRGVLRGAFGALVSRSVNGLDQSILLANFFETRVLKHE